MCTRSKSKFRAAAQEAMLSCYDVGQYRMSACVLASQKFSQEVVAAVLNKETGELIEYRHLVGNPKYRELWQYSYRNEVG